MGRVNIRTINAAKHNGYLPRRYQRVQNRASVVLDAYEEFGIKSFTIDVVAHMHRLSVQQIEKDLYGDLKDLQKRFGTKSLIKLQRTVEKCIKEIKKWY